MGLAETDRSEPGVARSPTMRTWGLSAWRQKLNHLNRGIVLLTLISSVPTMFLMNRGEVKEAGGYFWIATVTFCIALLLLGKPDHVISITIALSPGINMLRDFAFYNVAAILLTSALLQFGLLRPRVVATVLRRYWLASVMVMFVSYHYFASVLNTGMYWANIRGLELGLTALLVLCLWEDRPDLLRSALLGVVISAVAMGIGFLPYVDDSDGLAISNRLGVARVDDRMLGNPISLGLPLVFGFLGLLVDGGWWLGVDRYRIWRQVLLGTTAVLLALTTSRGSWLVAAFGLLVLLLRGKRQLGRAVLALGVVSIALWVLSQTPQGATVEGWIERTVAPERDIVSRTSGRSDQWQVALWAMSSSVDQFLVGRGAGNGPEAYASYSLLVPGVVYRVGHARAWHSYLLLLAMELGMLGLVPFLTWAFLCLTRIVRIRRPDQLVFPLACFAGYCAIILTVSGYDMASGVFVGIALLGTADIQDGRSRQGERPTPMAARLPVGPPPWWATGRSVAVQVCVTDQASRLPPQRDPAECGCAV